MLWREHQLLPHRGDQLIQLRVEEIRGGEGCSFHLFQNAIPFAFCYTL